MRGLIAVTSLVVVALFLPRVADAGAGALTPVPESPAPASSKEVYKPGVAIALPVLGTAASVGLIAYGAHHGLEGVTGAGIAGLALAPSFGHAYTGDWRAVAIGTAMRTGGAALSVGGIVCGVSAEFQGHCSEDLVVSMAMVGLGVTAGGFIYSFADAPASARRANQRERALTLAPAPIAGPDRSVGWGAQLSLRF